MACHERDLNPILLRGENRAPAYQLSAAMSLPAVVPRMATLSPCDSSAFNTQSAALAGSKIGQSVPSISLSAPMTFTAISNARGPSEAES